MSAKRSPTKRNVQIDACILLALIFVCALGESCIKDMVPRTDLQWISSAFPFTEGLGYAAVTFPNWKTIWLDEWNWELRGQVQATDNVKS